VTSINQFAVPGTDEAVFESVPMLDIEKQRRLIFEKYSNQCSSSVDATLKDLATLLNAPKNPSNAVKAGYINKVKELKDGIGKYEDLLERDMDIARQKCQLLQEQVKQLLDKEDVSPKKAGITLKEA